MKALQLYAGAARSYGVIALNFNGSDMPHGNMQLKRTAPRITTSPNWNHFDIIAA